jgi:membrane protease YdiL (CAAX protease family)
VAFAITSCVTLAAYNNIVAARPWHRRWYTAANVGAGGVALSAAAAGGLSPDDLGLSRSTLLPGVRLGARLSVGAAAGWLVAAAVPAARPVLTDKRISALRSRDVAYQATVRIPAGTVLWEEVAFRGVLQAALRRVMPEAAAIAVTSGIFGIWHIRPTVEALRINQVTGGRRTTATAASVAATTAAGALLSWLRARSGSLAAPVLLHLAANCGGLLAVWVMRGGARSEHG